MIRGFKRFIFYCFIAVVGGLMGCSDGDDENTPALDPPALVSSTPANGATDIAAGAITIVLIYDQNVTSPSAGHSSVSMGNATVNSVSASLTKVAIEASGLVKGENYELIVPAGVVLGPTKVGAPEVKIGFSTIAETSVSVTTSLCSDNPSRQAQNVYDFLLENYGTKVVSGAMSNVAWNDNEAEWVKLHTGKYPAMTTFDYIHLPYSPANWIDYSDISVAENWWRNNGLIGAGWHWIVPTYEGSSDYTYRPDETSFNAANATVEGTWENTVVKADLTKLAGYLKLLQTKNIPVIWRPLHEAAGNIYEYTNGTAWFWWGADGAEAYRKLWHYMFDFFQEQGLDNLIWVWTTQTSDDDFYPGDDYVDIIGRDVYEKTNASSIASGFSEIQSVYTTKMVTLSECGSVATLSSQWSAGAHWSYFMPWYDYDRTNDPTSPDFNETEHEHANVAWWNNAVSLSNVITREQMPNLK